jgi:hypothetical protein
MLMRQSGASARVQQIAGINIVIGCLNHGDSCFFFHPPNSFLAVSNTCLMDWEGTLHASRRREQQAGRWKKGKAGWGVDWIQDW